MKPPLVLVVLVVMADGEEIPEEQEETEELGVLVEQMVDHQV